MKKTAIALAACTLLSACSSISLNLDNRVTCTAAKDKGFVISQYGGVGIASQIAAVDAAVVCTSMSQSNSAPAATSTTANSSK